MVRPWTTTRTREWPKSKGVPLSVTWGLGHVGVVLQGITAHSVSFIVAFPPPLLLTLSHDDKMYSPVPATARGAPPFRKAALPCRPRFRGSDRVKPTGFSSCLFGLRTTPPSTHSLVTGPKEVSFTGPVRSQTPGGSIRPGHSESPKRFHPRLKLLRSTKQDLRVGEDFV